MFYSLRGFLTFRTSLPGSTSRVNEHGPSPRPQRSLIVRFTIAGGCVPSCSPEILFYNRDGNRLVVSTRARDRPTFLRRPNVAQNPVFFFYGTSEFAKPVSRYIPRDRKRGYFQQDLLEKGTAEPEARYAIDHSRRLGSERRFRDAGHFSWIHVSPSSTRKKETRKKREVRRSKPKYFYRSLFSSIYSIVPAVIQTLLLDRGRKEITH